MSDSHAYLHDSASKHCANFNDDQKAHQFQWMPSIQDKTVKSTPFVKNKTEIMKAKLDEILYIYSY